MTIAEKMAENCVREMVAHQHDEPALAIVRRLITIVAERGIQEAFESDDIRANRWWEEEA